MLICQRKRGCLALGFYLAAAATLRAANPETPVTVAARFDIYHSISQGGGIYVATVGSLSSATEDASSEYGLVNLSVRETIAGHEVNNLQIPYAYHKPSSKPIEIRPLWPDIKNLVGS